MTIEISRARFEQMVAEALGTLPAELASAMRNVVVVVEEGTDPRLLGLYEGIPLTERLSDYSAALPDKITIFQSAICARCSTEAEVVDEVRMTVVHEVGHHFGISDARLHELGW